MNANHDQEAPAESAVGASNYAALIRRRAWIIAAALLLTPVCAVVWSLRETPQYAASAQVLISQPNFGSLVNGFAATPTDPARTSSTLADLARVPAVVHRALVDAHLDSQRTIASFLNNSSVAATSGADLLQFSVRDTQPVLAVRLATAYARAFATYRNQLDAQALDQARAGVVAQLKKLAAAGEQKSAIYAELAAKKRQLGALGALRTGSAVVVQRGSDATKVRPRPKHAALLGLGMGLLLAVGLASLLETLDTRVRSGDELEQRLGRPILGLVPLPKPSSGEPLPMLDRPDGAEAEAFRMLRTGLDFVSLNRQTRSILVTSSVSLEGKSITSANLAVALALSRRLVILCDLDARRASLARLFGVEGGPGIADVALGRVKLEDALIRIPIRPADVKAGRGGELEGSLRLLTLGRTLPPDPGEFVGNARVRSILQQLKELADIVLVDGPPLLPVSDARTIATEVDGVIFVSRLKTARRSMVKDSARVLERLQTPLLGVVITDETPPNAKYEYPTYGHPADHLPRRVGAWGAQRR
jgi:capsular exopolysaccharide synthesis family protein